MYVYTILDLLFLFPAFFYLSVQIVLALAIRLIKSHDSQEKPFVSVIIAARNEEKNIDPLLQCLIRQKYPAYEIIVVNDRSTDGTLKILTEYRKNYSKITCVDVTSLPDDMPSKKNALRTGINVSKGEILCFTDADCLPPEKWIDEIVREFAPRVGLVAGYSPYRMPSGNGIQLNFLQRIFFKFICFEEFRAAIWSAGSIALNRGWLCTGRNLAYRRKVYDELEGFEKIKMSVSGDDDLFLQLVRKKTDWQIAYATPKTSFVITYPPLSMRSFIEQRKRHFSAAKYFNLSMKFFFTFYHLSNLLIFISPILYILIGLPLFTVLPCVLAKMLGDIILIRSGGKIFDAHNSIGLTFLMEAMYIFYNSIIGSLGIFRKFEWK